MHECIDSRHWPNTLSDVSDAEWEKFLAHSEDCPFHQQMLRQEEAPFMDAARLARGLTDDGRFAEWPEDRAQLDEYRRRYDVWSKNCGPAHRVSLALRYRGEVVTQSDYFFGLDALVVREFDEPGDLQLWKLPDDASDVEVFLGVYPIGGFAHNGAVENIELPNGQRAVLSVRRMAGNKYAIKLVCAEQEELDRLMDDDSPQDELPEDRARGHNATGLYRGPGIAPMPPPASHVGLLTRPFTSLAVLAILACITVTAIGLGRGTRGGQKQPQPPGAETSTAQHAQTFTDPPAGQADFSQGQIPAGQQEEQEARILKASVGDEPAQGLRRGAPAESAGKDSLKAQASPARGGSGQPEKKAQAATKSASAWYYLPNGPTPLAVWIRAGEDVALRDAFASTLSSMCDEGKCAALTDAGQVHRILQLRFVWEREVGTIQVLLSDSEGKQVKEFTCRSESASFDQARAQAIRGVILDLFSNPQASVPVGERVGPENTPSGAGSTTQDSSTK